MCKSALNCLQGKALYEYCMPLLLFALQLSSKFREWIEFNRYSFIHFSLVCDGWKI